MQKRVAERQRKWALEDEERKEKKSIEDEKRKIKRESLERRIQPMEEAVGLMINRVDTAVALAINIPTPVDQSRMRNRAERLQEVISDAWAAVLLTGSKELKENWGILATIYWGLRKEIL